MKIFILLLASLLLFATFNSSSAFIEYECVDKALTTLGGARFETEIGCKVALDILIEAYNSFTTIFIANNNQAKSKNITFFMLTIQSMNDITPISTNINGSIFMNSNYIGNYTGNDMTKEFTGIMYYEMARIRQWVGGNGQAPIGLLTGIADFFRLKASYVSASWARPGDGQRWDEGYSVTARFLDYCNDMYPGLVVSLNDIGSGYDDIVFVMYTGKTVDKLWSEYKAHYGG